MTGETTQRTVKSVENAFKVLEVLRELERATVSELANRVGLTGGSVHTHLATLKNSGYVVQEGTEYRLGPSLLTLGEHVRNRSDLYQAGKDQVDTLAKEADECAHLLVEHDGRMVTLYESFGNSAVGTEYHVRKREEALQHLHCTASGKAMLSRLPEDRVESILDTHGMTRKTRSTITDRDRLFQELEAARENGYAVADEEQITGIRAVGSPITSARGDVCGAISVSGPVSRLTDEVLKNDVAERVIRATNITEVRINTINDTL
jgi:IclR family transcriptional regulator, arginine deiminase pathway regulator